MRAEEKHLSFSIEKFEDVSQAFKDVGGPKSGIKLTGTDYAIWCDYSNASKETIQQFKQALLKHTIKNTLKTKGVAVLQVCFILAVLGGLLKGLYNTEDNLKKNAQMIPLYLKMKSPFRIPDLIDHDINGYKKLLFYTWLRNEKGTDFIQKAYEKNKTKDLYLQQIFLQNGITTTI